MSCNVPHAHLPILAQGQAWRRQRGCISDEQDTRAAHGLHQHQEGPNYAAVAEGRHEGRHHGDARAAATA